jgi:hypothetical protein
MQGIDKAGISHFWRHLHTPFTPVKACGAGYSIVP